MKRLLSVAIVSAVALTSLTACATGSSIVPNSHVAIAEVGTLTTLNSDVTDSLAGTIASDVSGLTNQSFYEVDKNGQLVPNTDFGTVTVKNQSPFTVTYTFGKNATWSDGTNLDATDLALAVTAAKTVSFNSTHFGSTLSQATIVGTPTPGSSSITLQFPSAIADWKTALAVSVPAHIVGKAAGIGGNTAAIRAGVLDAITGKKADVIAKLAAAYSTAFAPTADLTNFVSDGPYSYKSVAADKIVLSSVHDFQGLHSAIADTVNVSVFATNADAFSQAKAGKVDIFSPKPSLTEPESEVVSQSQGLGTKAVTVLAPAGATSEQFVINLGSGILADKFYKDPKTAPALRQAFMNMVPKARAFDLANQTQSVSRSDSFVYSSTSKNYSAVTGANGSSNFLLQDVEKAGEIVAALKLKKIPVVRVLFNSNDPAAVAEWTLLSQYASDAGIELRNISSTQPETVLGYGNYEVYLGPQPLMGVGFGSVQQLKSGPAHMPDALYGELTKDVSAANAQNLDLALQGLDKKLFDLGYGIPMYQRPTLLLFNNRIQGFQADPLGSKATWGYWNWHVSADK